MTLTIVWKKCSGMGVQKKIKYTSLCITWVDSTQEDVYSLHSDIMFLLVLNWFLDTDLI